MLFCVGGIDKTCARKKSRRFPVAKGDGSEFVWASLFRKYLPKRYAVEGRRYLRRPRRFSDEIDVAIYDRQYTPLIF